MKRIWMTAAAAVLALGMLAGCSGIDYPPSSSQPSSRPNSGSSSSSSATGGSTGGTGSSSSSGNAGSSGSASSKNDGASTSSSSTAASSKPEEISPWQYRESGDVLYLTGYRNADGSGLSGDVVIPDKIHGMTVVSIESRAFESNTGITSVTIPGTVITVGQYAFRGCTNLKKITLQEGVWQIGYYTFAGCTNLTEVKLPSTLNYIENLAFGGCANLEQIVIPENSKGKETKVQHCAFEDCPKLKKVYFPKTLKTIYYPFTGNTCVDYIYYGGTQEDWAKINITDGSISSATVILYKQKPADINTTPQEPQEPEDDLGDPNADELLYTFRQDVLRTLNVRRAKAGLKPLRMNNKALNEAAQQCTRNPDLNPWQLLNEKKVFRSKAGSCVSWSCGGWFAFGEVSKMARDDWYPDAVLNANYKTIGVGMLDGAWRIYFIG